MEVNIADLTWSPLIYPRGGKNEETVKAYVESFRIGAQFPPIKIQRVFNYADGNETTDLPAGRHGATIILDGIHRWFAFKESGIKKIVAVDVQRRRSRGASACAARAPRDGKPNPLITKKAKQRFSLNQQNVTSAMAIV
ncbi:MAG: hypothetical protein JRI72_08455 [Deltaproteobacteria bacterium]|nr:hypothetical protein [Deltaproteobacteria bacterium]